jgi:hypothetical protein
MSQTQEDVPPHLAERVCGPAACRDDAQVARRLERTLVVDGV